MKPGTKIEVVWTDAGLDTGDWGLDLPDLDPACQTTRTIGYFIKKSSTNLILAMDHFPANQSTPFRCVCRIPKPLIKEVTELSPNQKRKKSLWP